MTYFTGRSRFLPCGTRSGGTRHVKVEVIAQLLLRSECSGSIEVAQLFTLAMLYSLGTGGGRRTVLRPAPEVVTIVQRLSAVPTRRRVSVGLAAMCLVIIVQLAESLRTGRLAPREGASH